MRVNREKFLNQLELVEPGLATREIIEQSACFVFTNGWVITFNDEIACRQKSPLKITGAVQAGPLLTLLRKLTDVKLEITAEKNSFHIKGKRRGAKITMEDKIHLPIEDIETPKKWQDLPKGFIEAVKMVKSCASRDESSFKLTCIHLAPDYIEAMDNFQAMRVKVKTKIRKEVLIRRDSLSQSCNLNIKEMAETKRWIHFKTEEGLIISCRKYLEEYDDLDSIFKVKGKKIELPKGLKDAAEKAQIFSRDNVESTDVLLEIRPGKLRLSGAGTSGKFWEFADVSYSGPELEFRIDPELLGKIVTEYKTCQVTANRLKASGPNFQYIAALHKIEKNEED